MMKKVILLSVLAVSLTGCVVDPWDDDYRGNRDRNGHYDRDDRDHRNHDWKNKDHKDHRDWKRDRDNRDWRRDR